MSRLRGDADTPLGLGFGFAKWSQGGQNGLREDRFLISCWMIEEVLLAYVLPPDHVRANRRNGPGRFGSLITQESIELETGLGSALRAAHFHPLGLAQ